METAAAVAPVDFSGFEPNADRVLALDGRLRGQLRESVEYLIEQLEPHFALSQERVRSFFTRLDGGPLGPMAYAAYSDVVLAVDADELERAERSLDVLLSSANPAGGPRVLELGRDLSPDDSERYARYAESGSGLRLDLIGPLPQSARAARNEVQEALTLLASEDASLFAEMAHLAREVVLCRNGPAAKGVRFGGASNFMLWGAILINADTRRNRVETAQVLAHESAHNLLFALSPDQPLVANDPRERYKSPLRKDPRPMEGIYHAVFVCARMQRALQYVAPSPALSRPEKVAAKKAVEANARAFRDGMATLDQFADFTEPGRAIIEGARAYMDLTGMH